MDGAQSIKGQVYSIVHPLVAFSRLELRMRLRDCAMRSILDSQSDL